MRLRKVLGVTWVLCVSILSTGLARALDCEALRPGQVLREQVATQVGAEAKTLYKVAEAGGDVTYKATEIVKNISDKYPDANETEVKNRLIFLYCELLNGSTTLSDDKKFELLHRLVDKLLGIDSKTPAGPAEITRTYRVDETKDDHPVTFASHSRKYEKRFQADPGYEITDVKWHPKSAAHESDVHHNIAADRRSVVFSFRLTSGPDVDKWRGWIHGDLHLLQRRVP